MRAEQARKLSKEGQGLKPNQREEFLESYEIDLDEMHSEIKEKAKKGSWHLHLRACYMTRETEMKLRSEGYQTESILPDFHSMPFLWKEPACRVSWYEDE